MYQKNKIVVLMASLALLLLILVPSGYAMKPAWEYGDNECQKIAIQYQKEFGGSLIWIQPIDEQGNAILSEYGAHVINRVYDPVSKEMRYVDWGMKSNTRADYEIRLLNDMPARAYDLSIERPEFGLIWHY